MNVSKLINGVLIVDLVAIDRFLEVSMSEQAWWVAVQSGKFAAKRIVWDDRLSDYVQSPCSISSKRQWPRLIEQE